MSGALSLVFKGCLYQNHSRFPVTLRVFCGKCPHTQGGKTPCSSILIPIYQGYTVSWFERWSSNKILLSPLWLHIPHFSCLLGSLNSFKTLVSLVQFPTLISTFGYYKYLSTVNANIWTISLNSPTIVNHLLSLLSPKIFLLDNLFRFLNIKCN